MQRDPSPDVNRYAGALVRRVEALLVDGFLVGPAAALLGYVAGYRTVLQIAQPRRYDVASHGNTE